MKVVSVRDLIWGKAILKGFKNTNFLSRQLNTKAEKEACKSFMYKTKIRNDLFYFFKDVHFDLEDYVHDEDEILSEQDYHEYEYYEDNLEEESYSCDVCERDFFAKTHYDKHMSEHRTCNLDGCKFTAHEKIIENHIRMQHATGLYEKIRNVQTPEDIAKWIAERKRKYPSKENVEKRYKAQEELIKKGLRIEKNTNRFGKDKFRFTQTGKQPRGQFQNGSNRPPKKKRKPKPPSKLSLIDEKCDWNGNMFPFRGTTELFKNLKENEKSISDFEDDEWQQHKGITTVKVNNSLGSLMAAYGSDSDDMEENTQVTSNSGSIASDGVNKVAVDSIESISKETNGVKDNTKSVIKIDAEDQVKNDNNSDSDAELPEEVKIIKTSCNDSNAEDKSISEVPFNITPVHSFDIESKDIVKSTNKTKRKRPRQRNQKGKAKRYKANSSEPSTSTGKPLNTFPLKLRKRKVTLLERLLANEIRHERNLLLQCVRYVVENNFFSNS